MALNFTARVQPRLPTPPPLKSYTYLLKGKPQAHQRGKFYSQVPALTPRHLLFRYQNEPRVHPRPKGKLQAPKAEVTPLLSLSLPRAHPAAPRPSRRARRPHPPDPPPGHRSALQHAPTPPAGEDPKTRISSSVVAPQPAPHNIFAEKVGETATSTVTLEIQTHGTKSMTYPSSPTLVCHYK
ncbi:formin-like protein 14 [Bubalus bubalis]|uniref:formin-like protein 14 n=1 Tax=Bubalus bubalis TaxID=89462 RepID=UPI001E1B7A30|nr:formin-like protein 14 [Bubalus bubalis]